MRKLEEKALAYWTRTTRSSCSDEIHGKLVELRDSYRNRRDAGERFNFVDDILLLLQAAREHAAQPVEPKYVRPAPPSTQDVIAMRLAVYEKLHNNILSNIKEAISV